MNGLDWMAGATMTGWRMGGGKASYAHGFGILAFLIVWIGMFGYSPCWHQSIDVTYVWNGKLQVEIV